MKAKDAYNKLKKDYDVIPVSFFNKYIEIPAVKKILKNIKGTKILDVGCATGTHSKILHDKGAFVTGIDISKEMVKLAKDKIPEATFKIGNMKKLPFKNSSFDILFQGLCIHYEKNLKQVFKEAHRVLKKEGKIVISTHNPYYTGQRKIKTGDKYYRITEDYFSASKQTLDVEEVKMDIHPKTISRWSNPIIEDGFRLNKSIEPQPI